MLSENQILTFQELYRKRFGKEISKEDVLDHGIKLIYLMRTIYQPITKKELDNLLNN